MHEASDLQKLRIAIVVAGHTGDDELARVNLGHIDGHIRIASLGALERLGLLEDDALNRSMNDASSDVRRRAAEISASHRNIDLGPLLEDTDPLVVEMAAWACGEQMQTDDEDERIHRSFDDRIIGQLIELATGHDDALVRESCIAALGAIGDERALPAIISGCSDKPAVRRRAVLALAPFAGEDVDRTLRLALEDRDWQVRQAAEDVLGPHAASVGDSLDDQLNPERNEDGTPQ